MQLTEKGDKRLDFIRETIFRLRGEEPSLPGQSPQDPALPRGAGRPVNE